MRIGVVLDYGRDWPPGIRAEKQNIALSKAGFELFVLTPKYKNELPDSEYVEATHSTVDRVKIPSVDNRYIRNAITAITMYDSRFYQPIVDFIDRNKIDILHVHDIWLLSVSLKAAKSRNIPVIADLHENMPAAMVAARSDRSLLRKLAESVIWNYRWMRWKEKRMLKKCAHVIVVVEEAMDRLRVYGIDPKRVSVISNTEDETTFWYDNTAADQSIVNKYKDHFMCSYVGTTGAHRGIDTVLKAIPAASKHIPNLKIVIVGADPRSLSEINELIKDLNISRWVDAIGWQPFSAVQSYIQASKVCLVPHNDFEHTQTTVPHKLFQYMISKKPVLVSDCRPLKRIVEDAKAGLVFKASDPVSFGKALFELYEERDDLDKYGEHGREAALGKYAWKNDAEKLAGIYKSMTKS